LDKKHVEVAVGDKISIDFINEFCSIRIQRVDFITEPGNFRFVEELSMYFHFRMIIRTELSFGDEVESIRTFDVATQLSIETQKKITIIPNVENKVFSGKPKSDYISERQ
jgi:transcription-repair coupling factor (superfamily II helicase)